MIAAIQEHFIPVAVKAHLVKQPPPGPEGPFYEELRRTQPAPQGMAVMNSSGNVLAWSLMFNGDSSILKFLEHARKRFKKGATAKDSPKAERFQRFPDHKLPDLPASSKLDIQPDLEQGDYSSPGGYQPQEGFLSGRLVGRAVDDEGNLIDTGVRSQETYAEDRVEISKPAREALINTANSKDPGQPFLIPKRFARELVDSAYLGMLDVNPLGGRNIGGTVVEEDLQLWGRRIAASNGSGSIEFWGHTLCEGKAAQLGRNTDGRDWKNRVELNWIGRIVIQNNELASLVAVGDGEETLHWNHGASNSPPEGEAPRTAAANLPAGHPIQFSGPVRFGVSVP